MKHKEVGFTTANVHYNGFMHTAQMAGVKNHMEVAHCYCNKLFHETRYHMHLPLEAFDQVTNGHTGGDGMRIDDDIRRDPFTCERHVLGRRRGMNN